MLTHAADYHYLEIVCRGLVKCALNEHKLMYVPMTVKSTGRTA